MIDLTPKLYLKFLLKLKKIATILGLSGYGGLYFRLNL